MAFVDVSLGEWRCSCDTPGDPSAYDLSAHDAGDHMCTRCGSIRQWLVPMTEARFLELSAGIPDYDGADLGAYQAKLADAEAAIARGEAPVSWEDLKKAIEQGERDRAAVASMDGTGMPDTGMRFR